MIDLLFYKSVVFRDTYSDCRMHAFILILSPRDLKKVVIVFQMYLLYLGSIRLNNDMSCVYSNKVSFHCNVNNDQY